MPCNPVHLKKPNFEKLYVFGAGGFGREVTWLAEQSWGNAVEVEFVVDKTEFLQPDVNGHAVILLAEIAPQGSARFVVAIGNPSARRKIATRLQAIPLQGTCIVHPRSEMSHSVELGVGTIICAGAIITTNIHLGQHVHVNIDCTVGHDAVIGDFATLSPGVHVSGNVKIGENVFIGTGASIINGTTDVPLRIGNGAIIAAGSCVTKSVDAGAMVAGVPAVRKR